MNLLPRLIRSRQRGSDQSIHLAPIITELAPLDVSTVLARCKTALTGLSAVDAANRLAETGLNVVVTTGHNGWLWRLIKAMQNPLVMLLTVLTIIAFVSGDVGAASMMSIMIVISVLLRFYQEQRADAAAAKLIAMITVTSTVVRDGKEQEIPMGELVPGDIINLSAGDMIPADILLITAKDLFINQGALTGESLPVEKHAEPAAPGGISPLEFHNVCYLGTSVESGAATAVILTTGAHTYFGSMASSVINEPEPTRFDIGVQQFTWLIIRFILIMVPLVFVINGITKHDWYGAFFFAMAIAVGLTPEMLPMIVSVCLSNGALVMAKEKVIVKQLGSIQNLGAMDILCTDKTGTLTMDQVFLQKHCDVFRNENDDVFRDAFLIAHFQTGLKNMLDRAVLDHEQGNREMIKGYTKVDEINLSSC